MTNGDRPRGFASPPCFLHEIEGYDEGDVDDVQQRIDVARWRKAKRERLLAERAAIPAAQRRASSERIVAQLSELLHPLKDVTVSAYWPFRAEPEIRPFLGHVVAEGGRTALPVVVKPRQPLSFRLWQKGDPLQLGVWKIPIPLDAAPVVAPDIVIAPVVGFDPECYRLGYGGGFFDRTLASMEHRPRVIGIGYGCAAIPTIFPQTHDIPMDFIVTESGLTSPVAA